MNNGPSFFTYATRKSYLCERQGCGALLKAILKPLSILYAILKTLDLCTKNRKGSTNRPESNLFVYSFTINLSTLRKLNN